MSTTPDVRRASTLKHFARTTDLLFGFHQSEYASPTEGIFGTSLHELAVDALTDLQNCSALAATFDAESFTAHLRPFNIAALIWYRLGRGDIAARICHLSVTYVKRLASQYRRPEIFAYALQPAINIARMVRAAGHYRHCLALMESIYQLAVRGRPTRIAGVDVDRATAMAIAESNQEAGTVVETCRRIEFLRCALGNNDFGKVRMLLRHAPSNGGKAAPFELECRLKLDMLEGHYANVLRLAAKAELWAYLYVIDALALAGSRQDALDVAAQVVSAIHLEPDRERAARLLHAVALRQWRLDDACAIDTCVAAEKMSAAAGSEVTHLRALTLRTLMTDPDEMADRVEHVWTTIEQSRHAVERVISCAAMGTSCMQGSERFAIAARNLLQRIRPCPSIFHSVRRLITRKLPPASFHLHTDVAAANEILNLIERTAQCSQWDTSLGARSH